MIKNLEPAERFFFLLLYAPECGNKAKPIRGKIWLQKEMYAISRNVPSLIETLDYDNFRFGSFSDTVEELKDQYELSKYVESSGGGSIRLTQKGEKLAWEVWQTADPQETSLVQDIKEEFNDMNEDELLLFMYVTYPETAENSDVKDRILNNRLPLSISLLRKGKISVQKAAELSGMKLDDFLHIVKPNTNQ